MDKLFERFNLYDILAMVLPGCLWILCFIKLYGYHSKCCCCQSLVSLFTQPDQLSLFTALILILLTYIIGILWHSLVTSFIDWYDNWNCSIWNRSNKKYFQNNKEESRKIIEDFRVAGDEKITTVPQRKYYNFYKKAYANLRGGLEWEAITAIENQIGLLRDSMIPVLILERLFLWGQLPSPCCTICIMLLTFVIYIMALHERRYKILEKVYNGYCNTNKTNNTK